MKFKMKKLLILKFMLKISTWNNFDSSSHLSPKSFFAQKWPVSNTLAPHATYPKLDERYGNAIFMANKR